MVALPIITFSLCRLSCNPHRSSKMLVAGLIAEWLCNIDFRPTATLLITYYICFSHLVGLGTTPFIMSIQLYPIIGGLARRLLTWYNYPSRASNIQSIYSRCPQSCCKYFLMFPSMQRWIVSPIKGSLLIYSWIPQCSGQVFPQLKVLYWFTLVSLNLTE